MLRVLALAAEVLVLALIGYNLVVALWGWRSPVPAPQTAGRRRLRVIIPAHNEAAVLGRLLDDLKAQTYEHATVWVVADRCTDGTLDLIAGRAAVDERRDGPDGKGAVLAWHLSRHPLAPGEALVVLDADNRVPPELLARFADELEAGASVLQAYLDVSNPDASVLTTASALSYWASNRMVQLARRNLGWSADLGGTGMCLTAEALTAAGGFGTSSTEDQELVARLVLAGQRVVWLHDVRILDEKPASLDVVVRQRARWAGGKQKVGRRYGPALVRLAWQSRSLGPLDLAVRLAQPSRTFMALLTAVLAIVAGAAPSVYLLPWPLWAGAAVVQVFAPLPFLGRDGVSARFLWRYPLVTVFGILWIPVRVVSRLGRGWYHTPHRGKVDD
jgi:cellulose synthase/poly-beta-1,6-N-acetylglucosamine synthase-like glycosyltransferase